YATLATMRPPRLRIGWSVTPLMGVPVDPEVAAAVERTAAVLAGMGHDVAEESPEFDGLAAMRNMIDVWVFGFGVRIEGYAARSGRQVGPETLEPVTFKIYEYARQMKAASFVNALAGINTSRRRLGRYFAKYDVWLCPTTARVAEPWGAYNLGRTDVRVE